MDRIKRLLGEKKMVLLYVSSAKCGVCKTIKPQLKQAVQTQFPQLYWQELNAPESAEWSGQQQIFSVPTVVVYFEGKEWLHKSRNFSVIEILDATERPYQLFLN